MQRLLLLFLAIGITTVGFAQPDGEEFPDWTHTDINGIEHNLYSALDDGKIVVIDVFTTWCTNCLASLPNLMALEEEYGPNGTDQVAFFAFERDPETTNEASWAATNNVSTPIFSDALATMETWNTFYQPNYFVICPDRSFELVIGSIANSNPLPDLVMECMNPSSITSEETLEIGLRSTVAEELLSFTCTSPNGTFTIYSLNGQKMTYGKTDYQTDIDVSGLAEGIYLLQVVLGNEVLTRKFVRQ